MGWYVVRTKPKAEFRAAYNLKLAGFETFLPVEKVWIRHARRKEEKTRPLMPRYMFINFNLTATPWAPILMADGVERLLISANHLPVKVPDEAIEELKGLIRVGYYDETKVGWQGARPGDQLLLTKGPFRDFTVALKAVQPRKRVDIILNLFGALRELTVPLAWVRPA